MIIFDMLLNVFRTVASLFLYGAYISVKVLNNSCRASPFLHNNKI